MWPWAPWRPWWDCTPNIICGATQDCGAPGTLILGEDVADTHWDIANPFEVVLTANEAACCARSACPNGPCPEGECLVVSDICGIIVDHISGNPGVADAPELGLAYPGAVAPGAAAWAGDRPFAGTVNVDYAHHGQGSITTRSSTRRTPAPRPRGPPYHRRRRRTSPISTSTPSRYLPRRPLPVRGHVGPQRLLMSREYYETITPSWNPADDFWLDDLLVVIDSTQIPAGDGTYSFCSSAGKSTDPGTSSTPRCCRSAERRPTTAGC